MVSNWKFHSYVQKNLLYGQKLYGLDESAAALNAVKYVIFIEIAVECAE